MKNKILNLVQNPPFCKTDVVSSFLYRYVDWERKWYKPQCKFQKGDLVQINWKAKVYLLRDSIKPLPIQPMVFHKIDNDNVVDMIDGDGWNLYWLCRA